MESIQLPGEEAPALSPEQEAENTAAAQAAEEAPAEYVRPEKFASEADLGAAYAALEAKQSAAPAPDSLDIPADAEAPSELPAEDMAHYSDRYAANGKLEEADYVGLEGKGISRAMADSYVAGQVAIQDQFTNSIYNTVGGEEAYGKLVEWAGSTFTAEERAVYQEAVNSGDTAKASSAVKGLEARHRVENGSEPTLLQGRTGATTSGAYASLAEMKVDMRDPRYHKDPAFRATVTQKLSKSNIF